MILLKLELKLCIKQTNKKKKTGLKILFPKHMLQTLPIPLAQVKAGNRNFIE